MNALTPYLMYIKVALVAALIAGAVWTTRDHYKGVIAKQDLALSQASAALVKQKMDNILEGEVQHDKDQALINFLRNESGIVRIHIPGSCGSTEGTTDQDGRARLLSEKIDRALAEVQAGDGLDSQRADQINIDAIRSNTANR
jgi:hypothetical protein